MPKGKTCGKCLNYLKIRSWGGKRNGVCSMFDYNIHSDGVYAQQCKGYKHKRYERLKGVGDAKR